MGLDDRFKEWLDDTPFTLQQVTTAALIAAVGLLITTFIAFGSFGDERPQTTPTVYVTPSTPVGPAPPVNPPTVQPEQPPEVTETPPPVATPTPPIWHTGTITLNKGTNINLDAPPDDPLWREVGIPWGADIRNTGNTVRNVSPKTRAFVTTGPPEYETCNTTGYGDTLFNIPIDDLKGPDKILCVLTHGGRISVLKPLGFSPLTFQVTTYAGS